MLRSCTPEADAGNITCGAVSLVQASLEAATGAKAPPPPLYNGTKVHAAIGDGGSGTSNPVGGSVPIDSERLRAPLAAAAAEEVPASRRPTSSKAFGERAADHRGDSAGMPCTASKQERLVVRQVCSRHHRVACTGVAVAAGVMGALDAGRGFFGSLMQPKGDDQSTEDAADSQGGARTRGHQDSS